MFVQSRGGRARGKRSEQRPRGGAGQQRLNNLPSESLNSIRSEATASPEAPSRHPGAAPASAAERAPVSRVSHAPALNVPPEVELEQQSVSENDLSRLRAAWLIEPDLYERVHNWLADAMPFRWRERARRHGYWRRRAIPLSLVLVCVIIAVAMGNLGISVARQVSGAFASAAAIPPAQDQSAPGSVIISPLNNTDGTPTPSATPYTLGIWLSNTMPAGGSVTVYVRVSNNGAPVAKARVYIQSLVGNGSGPRLGPLTTNAYGMASANLHYGAGQGTPVFLTATTTIKGKTYTGTYTFVAF
jgi:hypothetical protein